jgi:hypothetical protein
MSWSRMGVLLVTRTPYINIRINATSWVRKFIQVPPEELIWHKDHKDRMVTLLKGSCYVMLDNQKPQYE